MDEVRRGDEQTAARSAPGGVIDHFIGGLRFASPPYEFRDIFSYFFTSRSRFSRDSRWIQNIPSS